MKFTPLKFQGTLAAAGISLMPYNLLKTTVIKGGADFSWRAFAEWSLGPLEHFAALALIALMFAAIVIHLVLTAVFLKELISWLVSTDEANGMANTPLAHTALFSPLISLPMSMVVVMGPVSFFLPGISSGIQGIMGGALALFALMWTILIVLEFKVVKVLFTKEFDLDELNFAWLLDVLAFGAVSLFGSGIATTADSAVIASAASLMTAVTLLIGIVLFGVKFTVLSYQQMKLKSMPGVGALPAFFLVIPPLCLLWFSFSKILGYAGSTYGIDTSGASFVVIVFSYVATMAWLVFSFVLLKDYFRKQFITSEFSPAQWGMV